MRHLLPAPNRFLSLSALLAGLVAVFCGPPVWAQTLQERIDAASPGETVLVAAGTYSRPVTVHKAITVEGQGTVRLAGLTGSQAIIRSVEFDGTLLAQPAVVTAGDGLTLENCLFDSGVEGLRVTGSAVQVSTTRFEDLVTAITLQAGASLNVSDSEVVNCQQGLLRDADPLCTDGPRGPAAGCEASCPEVTLTRVAMTGGTRQVSVVGHFLLRVLSSSFVGATEEGIKLHGGSLLIEDSVLTGPGSGAGIRAYGTTGHVFRSTVSGWSQAVVAGDGNCSEYSTLQLGGTLGTANALSGLVLEQPEAIPADLNFWGTVDCAAVSNLVVGQTVATITDVGRTTVIDCTLAPVERNTWGAIKQGTWRGTP